MKTKCTIFLVTIFLTLFAIGQNTTLKGVVKDNNKEIISSALIYIYHNDTIFETTSSDSKGNFIIKNVPNGQYTATVIALEYKKLTEPFVQLSNIIFYNFHLEKVKSTTDSVNVSWRYFQVSDSLTNSLCIDTSSNNKDSFGRKQGLWKIRDKKGVVKKLGNFKDDKEVGEWLFFKFKKPKRQWFYHYDFSSGKKKLKWLYYTDGACGYKYIYKNGKLRFAAHYNLSW